IDIGSIVHHTGEDDCCGLLYLASRAEIVEVDAVADERDRDAGDQSFEIALFRHRCGPPRARMSVLFSVHRPVVVALRWRRSTSVAISSGPHIAAISASRDRRIA